MKVSRLASKVANHEGLKSQVSIGDIREIIAIICDEMVKDHEVILALVANGKRRLKRVKRVK